MRTRALTAVATAALTAVLATAAAAAPAAAFTVSDLTGPQVTLLVHTQAGAGELRDLLGSAGDVRTDPRLGKLDVTRVTVPAAWAPLVQRRLAAASSVQSVEVDGHARVLGEDTYRFLQTGLDRMNVPTAWQTTRGAADVTVAVVDTGVRADHVDLADAVAAGVDIVNDDTDASDDHGHGTGVASLIAAAPDNDEGIAGVCSDCTVLPVKALGADGVGSWSDIAEGIVWAADNGADVINLSIGGTTPSDTLAAAIQYAHDKGAVLVASAGNESAPGPSYPAAYPHVISVAALNDDGTRYASSNYGAEVDVAAVGCAIVANHSDVEPYVYSCGTSTAAPQVAGIAALMRAAQPAADAAAVERALQATARQLPDAGIAAFGEPDAAAAVAADVVSPTVALTSPAGGAILRGTATLTATATDDRAVTKVDFFNGATLLGTDATAPYSLAWATTGSGPATLTAVAHDTAGNQSRAADVAATVDNTAPTAAITAPADGARLAGTVPVTVAVTDDTGVARVDLYSGTTWIGASTTAPFAVNLDTARYADGTAVALKVKATDAAGNIRYSTVVNATVDNAAPTVALTSPSLGSAPVRGTVTLTADAADNTGVDRVEFYNGATLLGTDATAPYSLAWATSGAESAKLTAVAIDAAGNRTTSVEVPVVVDNIVPIAVITSPSNNATVSGTVTITTAPSDNVAVAKVDLFDGATWVATATAAPWTLTWDTSKVAKGSHTLKIKVTDTAGNVRYAQVIVTVA